MKYITAKTDYGEKETFEKWNGKFYSEKDLDEIISIVRSEIKKVSPELSKQILT